MQPAIHEIEHNLSLLREMPDARLLLSCPGGWLVLHSYSPPVRGLLEAATSQYLPEETPLSKEGEELLLAAGFRPRRGKRSLGKMVGIALPEKRAELAAELAKLLENVYGCREGELTIGIETVPGADVKNPLLLDAMKLLSRNRTHECRVSVYQQLINATLLLATADGEPMVVGSLGKWSCYGAFTDYASMRQWDPRGCAHRQLYGIDLFPLLQELDAGSLLLNPGGDVRGELYKNEIDTMVRAVSRFK